MLSPPSLRSPRAQVLAPIKDRHLSSYLRIPPPCPSIPHVASDLNIRLNPLNILLSTLLLLKKLFETSLASPPHLDLATFLFPQSLNPFLESHPSSVNRCSSHLRSQNPRQTLRQISTARSRRAGIILPITTHPPLLNLISRNPNNPRPRTPFSVKPRRVSPDLTVVRRVSSPLQSRLNQLALSSPAFPRWAHHTKLLFLDRRETAERLL